MRPIALLTDFGLIDPYVGQVRAVLTRLAPGAPLLDISHQVQAWGTAQAAFFLAASAPHFPEHCVFVCVVDPGVGTARRILGAQLGEQTFLAPDSGLLGLLLETPGLPQAELYDVSPAAEAYSASATFHGRDIFAPLAARLAQGEALGGFGPPLKRADIKNMPWNLARQDHGGLDAHVLHVDHFGNCVLSVRQDFAFSGQIAGLVLGPGEAVRLRLVRTYAELGRGEAGLLLGSQGFYELAANQASAAALFTLRSGDPVRLAYSTQRGVSHGV